MRERERVHKMKENGSNNDDCRRIVKLVLARLKKIRDLIRGERGRRRRST
jgi:hypothetical protein